MSSRSRITRREFVQAGAGLVISFYVPSRTAKASAPGPATPFAPNAWLRIDTDGLVTLTLDRSEMGQGSQTGLAIILAEELEADWSTVRLGPMPVNPAAWSRTMRTGGSNAIRGSWEPLRKAGAAAREMLVTAAADTWQVDRGTCRADNGAVVHAASGRRLPYGRLVTRAATLPVPTDAPLKDPKQFRMVGTRVRRLDTPSKVDGSAQFGIDVKVPDMLVASIERAPVLGGRIKRVNAERAKGLPGVRHVVELQPSSWMGPKGGWAAGCAAGVAVVADT
ncbi:MAG TPA: molybdopterin cofactor-binding domain-containing protein, partial [Gemmatimonadales bacterium]|nr:molybdopterin cofactor-binding domain-containing protein [Gemmatimonadales bacterium]